MKKELKRMPINGLIHAPWNPRTPDELSADNEKMQELVATIKSVGVLQPIAVWEDSDDGALVIAGNRRLEAAKICGLKDIPAQCFTDIDEKLAREITRVENEFRCGIDPIADARQIADMKNLGYTQQEIAARWGISEAMVCRRSKLIDLDSGIADAVKGKNVETKALELISSYSPELQKSAKKALLSYLGFGRLTYADASAVFVRMTQLLCASDWYFHDNPDAFAKCKMCGCCTGTQPDLFDSSRDDDYADDGIGRCMDSKCFKAMKREAMNKIIAKITAGAAGVEMVKSEYSSPFRDLKAKKMSKKNCWAYVCFNDWSGRYEVRWGVDPKLQKMADLEEIKRREQAEAADRAAAEKTRADKDEIDRRFVEYFKLDEDDNNDYLHKIFDKHKDLAVDIVCEFVDLDAIIGQAWDVRWKLREKMVEVFSDLKNTFTPDQLSIIESESSES